ncbi:MAG: glycine--tRNA ligase subunit beta, partial [Burkholderiaceae bacterium]
AAALGEDPAPAERAALLAKTDLLTGMVGEFPELQGIMGRYYATHDGEPAAVADAIAEQYQPRFAGDALPASSTGTVLALADKLETLAGLFGIGQLPTGDKDPFALRRHALGVLRMLIEKRLPLALDALIDDACAAFGSDVGATTAAVATAAAVATTAATTATTAATATATAATTAAAATDAAGEAGSTSGQGGKRDKDGKGGKTSDKPARPVRETLLAFFHDRLAGYLRELGYSANEVAAVVDQAPTRLADLPARLKALREFARLPEAQSLAGANKRIGNILKKSGPADAAATPDAALDAALLVEPAEKALAELVAALEPQIAQRMRDGDFDGALLLLAQARTPVDAFFDQVMVMAEDPAVRANRLALLARLQAMMNRVADISRLAV